MHCLYKGFLVVFQVVLIGIDHVELLIVYPPPPQFFLLSAIF